MSAPRIQPLWERMTPGEIITSLLRIWLPDQQWRLRHEPPQPVIGTVVQRRETQVLQQMPWVSFPDNVQNLRSAGWIDGQQAGKKDQRIQLLERTCREMHDHIHQLEHELAERNQ